ncbi:RNA polymerase sigma-70 factor, ECF subfamily [Streptosporangium canum]|uniref:RNA polymerase sigma-70 factor, ECF subfamily n=1 Tax=Streptosporangium canum TaxID=324952 RepID=A0A1I3UNE6_9ACTN|nr:RNA polymerase sigma factor [Streptosporangium canum]SFJ84223.1 RNA polymerase sigma-70 factor, ECF subfamily [Streptosporangium canum]
MNEERLARFEAVYRQTYGQITAYAIRRCIAPQDAADVVAETFAIAWRKVDKLPRGEPALLWLYGVARKVLANHYRTDNRRRARTVELDGEMTDLYAAAPESGVEAEAVARVFTTLPDDDREVLALVAWEGLDREEVAAVLGLTRNAVRVRLHRARKRFARALTEAGVRTDRLVSTEGSL